MGSGTRRAAPAILTARMHETDVGWRATLYLNGVRISWTEGEREEVLNQLRLAGVRDVIWPSSPVSILRVTGHGGRKLALTGNKPRNRDK